jgi:anthranilate phosphoribosyltransferase
MAPLLAGVFAERGIGAAVVRGDDGLDELTLAATSTVWWARDGRVRTHTLDPGRLGLAHAPTEALRGGDAAHNAEVVRRLLAGERGPVRDAVVLNAGLALAVCDADGPSGTEPDLHEAVGAGMVRAAAAIDSGAAASTLDRWVSATRGPGGS